MPLSMRRSFTRRTPRLVRQHRLDRGPFIIAEFVAHDLKLQFRSLNHVHGNSIKPHKLAAKPLMLWIYFRFRRNSGHGRACHRLRPVANDPFRTLSLSLGAGRFASPTLAETVTERDPQSE